MKVATFKSENKKRKRDDSKEVASESPKKAKVHAQRKFAQGAAYNNSVITPIKDKTRPATATPTSGPMLTSKCPNTEDFLTFLCFRRTSILPPKLDFFKEAAGSENDSSVIPNKVQIEKIGGNSSAKKQITKKISSNEDKKKSQPEAVQALRKKYQEQRLAKHKVTNVTKLAQKVKGKNMIRTRSSVAVDEDKPTAKKRVGVNDKKATSTGLRSGLKRSQPVVIKPIKKVIKPKHMRTGLRSGGPSLKISDSVGPAPKAWGAGKKGEKETKKPPPAQVKGKNLKLRKPEGLSDFSSDDNEPLMAVKKPKLIPKKSVKVPQEDADKKDEAKTFVKTRSQVIEPDTAKVIRPTRKTKEAAALYVEMITKKLVSPEKSGDEDVSSVDSFPELPNAKKSEQRESEIKAKALANKKIGTKAQEEEKEKEERVKKATGKKGDTSKPGTGVTKEDCRSSKKAINTIKKEVNNRNTKEDKGFISAKRQNRSSTKDKQIMAEEEKKEQVTPTQRPSTRSRPQEEAESSPKKPSLKTSTIKMAKSQVQSNESLVVGKNAPPVGKKTPKGKTVKIITKEEEFEPEKSSTAPSTTGEKDLKEDSGPKEIDNNKTEKCEEEGKNKAKEEKEIKKSKKVLAVDKTEVENKVVKKVEKKEGKTESTLNKRPTRKCSAADKLCFEIDAFTSDEEDFETFKVAPVRSSMKKIGGNKDKEKTKNQEEKKSSKTLSNCKGIRSVKEDARRVDGKMGNEENKIAKETASSAVEPENGTNKTISEPEGDKNKEENALSKSETAQSVVSKKTKAEEIKVENKSHESQEETIGTNTAPNKKVKDSSFEEAKESAKKIQIVTRVEEPFTKKDTHNSKQSNKEVGDKKEEGKKSLAKESKKKGGTARTLRERPAIEEQQNDEEEKPSRRTRPVRQCSTGEKRWIETDSDFSFYDTSDDEDNLLIFDFDSPKTQEKSSLVPTNTKETKVFTEENREKGDKKADGKLKESNKTDKVEKDENFSDSDEEPLKKKSVNVNLLKAEEKETLKDAVDLKSPMKIQRNLPGLTPLKGTSSEAQLVLTAPALKPPPQVPSPQPLSLTHLTPPTQNISVHNQSKPLFYDPKSLTKSNISIIRSPPTKEDQIPPYSSNFFMDPVVSVPNRIEMILHTLKKDKLPERPNSYSNDVKVTFGNVPYHPVAHSSQVIPNPCNFQVRPIVNFPTPREPISTHGLDLLSEVALPTTPKEKLSSQTERIEKWLKDSLAAEQKKSFPPYEDNMEYKGPERDKSRKTGSEKPEVNVFFGKPAPPVNLSSQTDVQKFGQAELSASQKLLKKNLFAAEVGRVEHQQQPQPPATVKKTLTSVQDLLKLQKEKKEAAKSQAENSPHLKNCKCNNCIVKKGWFKNKPVPKVEHPKVMSSTIDDGSEAPKPFESLTKAFKVDQTFGKTSNEVKNSKMSVSVAPIFMTSSPPATKSVASMSTTTSVSPGSASPSPGKESHERKGIFQQRKLSFLERMKERERKEAAAAKGNANAFSPNNESSVYAFDPEPEAKPTPANVPARSKIRESRTSSTSKSDDDCLRICEDESCATVSSGTQVERTTSDNNKATLKPSQSASIAVQVNLDSETVTEVETLPEIQDGKSIEISTQTEVPEEDSDSPMFYIPLQQTTTSGADGSSDQQLIQGVALKLGTEGPKGPNQRVVMKAKLVTKPPDVPSIKAVVMPQPKRIFDQKSNNPPIGTVQPTTRKPPEEPKTAETAVETLPPPKEPSRTTESISQTPPPVAESHSSASKTSKNTFAKASKSIEKVKEQITSKEKVDVNEECSTSSSASSKGKRGSKQKPSENMATPSGNTTWVPPAGSTSKMVEAPTFYATEKDFQDPFEFFERIRPAAEKFGLCRIVPPSTFKPDCKVSDDMRFTAYNQYVHRMFHRWGPNIKEMMAIKKYLATQSISLKQPPWVGGIEIDLPRLYQSVQNCGGLMKVMEKKKWHQVADMMRIPKAAQDRVTKLDDIYCKYLLPYDTLSPDERQKLFDEVEKDWAERQRVSPEDSSDSQGDDDAEEENYIEECEECVVKGRNMALNQFYRIARNTMSMWFKNPEPSPREVENEFWRHVGERNHHVCVHSGSIDSSGWGYGFPVAKNNSFSKHPWNLKVLTNNSRSVLRSLGPAMGVTVPTLHVGMVFTAFCWYRDPHGLPWIEYLHTGAPKIWYGISDDNSNLFQEALGKLLPRYIKNKTIWLPSDTAMIPPALLVENGVSLCHTVQEPGQFILVFPRAFISSICTGYMVSESVYFAQSSWLTTAEQAFKDIQESCEPSMFSLEKLLFSIATDSRSSVEVLKQVLPMVWHVRQKEIDGRKTLFNLGLKTSERLPSREGGSKKKKGRWTQDDEGDYECEVCRMNLFVSLVTNSQEEGTYCLPHAIELLTQKRQQLKYCKLMYNYSQDEMNELVEKLEQKIENKSQKKAQNQSKCSTSAK